jgi:hypothetical protein
MKALLKTGFGGRVSAPAESDFLLMEVHMRFVVLLVVCVLNFSLWCSAGSAREPDKFIAVHHEWGRLKEVVVGISDDLVVPSYNETLSFFLRETE